MMVRKDNVRPYIGISTIRRKIERTVEIHIQCDDQSTVESITFKNESIRGAVEGHCFKIAVNIYKYEK